MLKANKVFLGIFCLVSTVTFWSISSELSGKNLKSISEEKSEREINQIAAAISVKVLDKDFLGSGFLVQKEGNGYNIVTNQHVLRSGEAPYRVQTSDGSIYRAQVIKNSPNEKSEYDLAVLQFQAETNYPIANIGSSLYLEIGEPIFAAGFPYTFPYPKKISLAVKFGRVAIVLDKALEAGYRIGATNDVQKGMSGGALLNKRGEVVGVNGKHAYPLWQQFELYQDGTLPCEPILDFIERSSFAIPVETVSKFVPEIKREPSLIPINNSKLNWSKDLQLINKMKTEAEVAKSCKSLTPSRSKNDRSSSVSLID